MNSNHPGQKEKSEKKERQTERRNDGNESRGRWTSKSTSIQSLWISSERKPNLAALIMTNSLQSVATWDGVFPGQLSDSDYRHCSPFLEMTDPDQKYSWSSTTFPNGKQRLTSVVWWCCSFFPCVSWIRQGHSLLIGLNQPSFKFYILCVKTQCESESCLSVWPLWITLSV